MKFSWRFTVATAGLAAIALLGFNMIDRAAAQGKAAEKGKGAAGFPTAGEVFKNVTTDSLKVLSTDDFLGAMGVVADDLGLDCADCHPGAGTDKVDWVIDTPQKITARKMINMVANINKTNFSGVQMVTCYTCHHGRDIPATTIALDAVYDTPNKENDDIVRPDRTQPAATAILDKYIAAVGGAQKWAGITSFISTGVSVGYEGLGGNGEFTIYAKAPNQHTTVVRFKDHPERGDSTWAFNGTTGWINVPRGLLGEYETIGGERDGARLEAQLAFPGNNIKTALNNWRVGSPQSIGDRDFQVVQGTGPRGLLATLYFDTRTGLLSRVIRYSPSPIGRMPTQIDYSDYRDVNGVKFPFEYTFLWLDGRYTAKINNVRTNVAVDPAFFGKPSARK